VPPKADPALRVMFWRIDLKSQGPGVALRDILARAPRPVLLARVTAHIQPDILVLSGLDYDHGLVTLAALRDLMAEAGHIFDHIHAYSSNAGLRTGLDLNMDGRTDTPDDAQGFGHFTGQKGLAVLSRLPIDTLKSRDFSDFRWADLPATQSPHVADGPMADLQVHASQRLSSTGHWDIAVTTAAGPLHVLVWQAGPPAFGGAGPRNKMRNHDETAFWTAFLDRKLPFQPPDAPFVLVGGSNLDPFDGDGDRVAIRELLAQAALQDPEPASAGAVVAAKADPRSAVHTGPHATDTVHWPQEYGPGNLRVSYILPSAELTVHGGGVFWPAPDDPLVELLGTEVTTPSRHRPVWVDIER
jgi:hypothetical protein